MPRDPVPVSVSTPGGIVSELADRNTEKYERWLNLISDLADKAEFRNVSAALSHLTAAGTVLEDPQVVYVSEFLEWLTNNLRPALVSKKGRPERDEAAKIVKEALAAAIGALRERWRRTTMAECDAAPGPCTPRPPLREGRPDRPGRAHRDRR